VRTEDRAPCASFEPLRQPFFGDLHVHTSYSADAYIFGTKVTPRDAYAFAQGSTISLCDDQEQQTRSARLDRPLDFAAVTDHSEFFGEVRLCSTPGSLIYDEKVCQDLRKVEDPSDRFNVIVEWQYPAGIDNPPPSLPVCNTPGVDCDASAVSVWKDIQAAADEAYDRSDACTFTSFVAYEHTASPLGRHLHRNIIFRNQVVPGFAYSQLETASHGTPQGVWDAIETNCLNVGNGCDAVIIPHNPNLSGGMQFEDPLSPEDALRRQQREPLVEIHQIKGNSECRYDRIAGAGVGTTDELCSFEQMDVAHQGPDNEPPPSVQDWPRRNLVRNALEDGLSLEQSLGANPFRMGFVGDTDSHDGAAGNTEEQNWEGGQGSEDSSPERQLSANVLTNPGGLTGVWAEENSRDALFTALQRRETFATSGTRPVVRLFGGALDGVACDSPDMIARAYATGTPMGGELGAVRGGASPRFAVMAIKDPGTAQVPGTDLQRVQIIKGWSDASGAPHEHVYDVAGSASDATVDHASCAPPAGVGELCTVWQDPDFDPSQRAFYYARVLEMPSCRWSTLTCKAQGVDPFSSDCAAQAKARGDAFADCCLTQASQTLIEPVIQERAWTSPIWYRPDSIATVSGAITRRHGGRSGTLDLQIALARVPDALAAGQADLTVVVSSGAELLRVTYAAGNVPLTVDDSGAGLLHVTSDAVDLSQLGTGDASVQIRLESGLYRAEHVRRWQASDGTLAPASA
jgi:hypothetical protein